MLPRWLDSLRADARAGWRQLCNNKIASAAAVLSLGLGIGACVSAFRLVDALLWRPLPVAHPEQLYAAMREGFGPDGQFRVADSFEYPLFRQMREVARGQADLIATSFVTRQDLTYAGAEETEKAYLEWVSGGVFHSFGLQPALGRLLTESDDLQPGAHPVVVISYDYWQRRFGKDSSVVGSTVRIADAPYRIIGVVAEGFTGMEPGRVVDIFLPAMMNPFVTRPDSSWLRAFARVRPGVAVEPLRQKLHAVFQAYQEDRAKGFTGWPRERLKRFLQNRLLLEPAPTGLSQLQQGYRTPLLALGVLVALALLIACVNVANLMVAQTAAREREMAVRISIGAGRWRLIQLVLVESAWLALLSAATGAVFAWWSAPFVVSKINPPDQAVRLALPMDFRVFGFGLTLTIAVMLLFGLAPALRASAVRPLSQLKGGEDPRSRRRLTNGLVAAQVAFCFIVHFVATLFVTSFDRFSRQPTGFSDERLLTLITGASPPQAPILWRQVADHLRRVPGVETVAAASFPLLSGTGMNGFVSAEGRPPGENLAYFLNVSPGWMDAMRIPLVAGRDLRPEETAGAIINETFAKTYFPGESPIGRTFVRTFDKAQFQVVGISRDARYRDMREQITATAYIPFRGVINGATFVVRTASGNPMALAPVLRKEVTQARPGFRVSTILPQSYFRVQQSMRERLLATLALFFASVALLLAGIGFYSVLDYSILQRRREIGIRVAVGARPAGIAWLVTADVLLMTLAGAALGLAAGMTSARYIEALLYQVKPGELGMLAGPLVLIVAGALFASLAPVLRAIRIDPVTMLRSE